MDSIEKLVYINKLLSIYGELLTNTQKDILSDYYNLNLSITEISEERNISRSAVEDALKKGVKKLLSLENTLNLQEKREKTNNLLTLLENEKSEEKRKELITSLREENK